MSKEERETSHIKKLVDLVVVTHHDYTDFEDLGDWFLANKRLNSHKKLTDSTLPSIYRHKVGFFFYFRKTVRQMLEKFTGIIKGRQ